MPQALVSSFPLGRQTQYGKALDREPWSESEASLKNSIGCVNQILMQGKRPLTCAKVELSVSCPLVPAKLH